MKKLLSFILTLALTLLPTFAAAVDMEAAILTPTKFTLDFSTVDTSKLYKSSGSYFLNTAEGSNYIAQGKNGDWCIDNDNSKSTLLRYTSNPVKFYVGDYPKSNYLQLSFNKNRISGANSNPIGDAISFNFTVPASGYYDVKADIFENIYGGIGNFYIDNKFVCEYDFYNAPTSEDANGRIYSQEISIGTKSIYLFKGEHTIRIVAEYSSGSGDYAYVMLHSFAFTPATSQINPYVSFVQTTNVDGHNDITVKSVERGASVTLTAHAKVIPGYEFVGWKRGSSDDESAWVDINGDTYNVWTNTFLTAIYKPTGETATAATVDFWNQNGAYLGTATEDTYATDVKRVPTLTGFGAFQGWFTDGKVQLTEKTELKAGTTNAVAQYEDGAVSGVTRDNVAVDGEVVYNKAITFEKEDASSTCWMRDGKTISYDDTYTYNVWGATNITEGTHTGDKTPVAILEYNDTYKAYMLEYDDGDYAIVEAGILFGGNMTVDSCTKKYTSQRKVEHNQFTVPAGDYTTAKGYIIWKNASGVYQIDYFTVAQQ